MCYGQTIKICRYYDTQKRECKIYPIRPSTCRAYPLTANPENPTFPTIESNIKKKILTVINK